MRSFNCQDVGVYGHLLMADYTVECPLDDKSGFIFTWSLLFALAYPVGIPLSMICILYKFEVPQMAAQKLKDAKIRALVSPARSKIPEQTESNVS